MHHDLDRLTHDELLTRIELLRERERDVRDRLSARVDRPLQHRWPTADPVAHRLSWVLARVLAEQARALQHVRRMRPGLPAH